MVSFTIPTIFTALDRMSAPLSAMGAKLKAFDSNVRNIGTKSKGAFNALTFGLGDMAIAGGIGLATLAVTSFVNEASKIENATAAFTPMLGSVANATKLVNDLNKAAAETPFRFNDLAEASNTLLGFGAATQKNIIPTLKMLGDVAQGDAAKLGRIALAFGQIKAGGKANLQDINQLINNGVPILAQLGKQWGMTVGQARKAIGKGKGSAEEITKAFEIMTGKGGMFFNGMAIASQTFTGRLSTLKDNISLTFAAIGTEMLPILKTYLDQVSQAAEKVKLWVQSNKELIQIKVKAFFDGISKAVKFLYNNMETIITALKIYGAVLLFVKTISFAVAIYESVMAIAAFTVALWGGVAATWALLWPILLVLAAIALIVGAFYLIYKAVSIVIQKWNEWGAALTYVGGLALMFFSPILAGFAALVGLVMSFIRNWDMIKKAFADGGILAGFKAIGATILDSVLMPLQQVLKIISNLTGFDWAGDAVKSIETLRKGLGVSIEEEGSSKPVAPAINPKATEQDAFLQRMESVQKQNVSIDINDPTGRSKVRSDNNFVPIKLTSTMGF